MTSSRQAGERAIRDPVRLVRFPLKSSGPVGVASRWGAAPPRCGRAGPRRRHPRRRPLRRARRPPPPLRVWRWRSDGRWARPILANGPPPGKRPLSPGPGSPASASRPSSESLRTVWSTSGLTTARSSPHVSASRPTSSPRLPTLGPRLGREGRGRCPDRSLSGPDQRATRADHGAAALSDVATGPSGGAGPPSCTTRLTDSALQRFKILLVLRASGHGIGRRLRALRHVRAAPSPAPHRRADARPQVGAARRQASTTSSALSRLATKDRE